MFSGNFASRDLYKGRAREERKDELIHLWCSLGFIFFQVRSKTYLLLQELCLSCGIRSSCCVIAMTLREFHDQQMSY